jgi:hypothetical protein
MRIDYKKAELAAAGRVWTELEKRTEREREFYGKLAEWGERVSLALLVSLVIQQLLNNNPSLTLVIIPLFATGLMYVLSYYWLKKSKPF